MFVLIRHRKLSIVFIAIGKREVDDVVPRVGDVELQAVGRGDGQRFHIAPRCRCDFDGHLTEVLREGDREIVAVDGGLDGGTFGDTLHIVLLYECC